MKKNIAFIVIIFTLLILIKGRIETINNISNSTKLSNVKQEYEEEKNKNRYLKERLSYVKSESFVEKQAREKLNLTKKNEVVVITNNNAPEALKKNESEKKPNLQKWWEKFF